MQEEVLFAPLIRVSTETQARRGQSLETQRTQLENIIKSMGGKVNKWYAGQEHATPAQDRKILDDLLKDAGNKKFDAVIVCDTSRWSRDNMRSKSDLNYLREHGIRFFVGYMEFDLSDPKSNYIMGLGVESEEFYAAQQNQKSLINCIEKAKKGYPTKGKIPYGRIFDKKEGKWLVDKEKKGKVQYAVGMYLNGTSMRDLTGILGICCTSVHYLFSKRLGENWEIKFTSKKFNINETVKINIPPLVADDIICKVKEKLEANKTLSHGQTKNQYLLGRMIFCGHCGYALVGAEYHGRLYYRHQTYHQCGAFGSIRADDIENEAFEALFENFGDSFSISESIKRAMPDLDRIRLLNQQMDDFKGELHTVDIQRNRLIKAIADGIITNEDTSKIMVAIREKESFLKENVVKIQAQLDSLPTEKQISMNAQLLQRTIESYYRCDSRKREMTFEDKHRVLQNIFSGKTFEGKRAGVYITSSKDLKRPWHYEMKGTLNLYNFYGHFGNANVNLIDTNHSRRRKNPGYSGTRSPDCRRKPIFQFSRRGNDHRIAKRFLKIF